MTRKIADLIKTSQPKDLAAENRRLLKRIDELCDVVHRLRKPRVKLRAKKGRGKSGCNTRVFCGDSHGAYVDKKTVAAFLADLDHLKPDSLVHVGDALDCGGFMNQHHVIGTIAESEITFEDDCHAANELLDQLQARVPDITLIEGNHEHRITRWCLKQTLAHHKDAKFLLSMFGPAAVLHTEARGIRFIDRHKYYDELSISGTIKYKPGGVAQHGEAVTGKNATFRQLDRLGKSVHFGNTHRLMAVYQETLDGTVGGFNTGCLCQIRPLYGLTKTTDWTNGYVLQVHDKTGFLSIPVPILNGVSYLRPLLKLLEK